MKNDFKKRYCMYYSRFSVLSAVKLILRIQNRTFERPSWLIHLNASCSAGIHRPFIVLHTRFSYLKLFTTLNCTNVWKLHIVQQALVCLLNQEYMAHCRIDGHERLKTIKTEDDTSNDNLIFNDDNLWGIPCPDICMYLLMYFGCIYGSDHGPPLEGTRWNEFIAWY